jgi:hypothetical protein
VRAREGAAGDRLGYGAGTPWWVLAGLGFGFQRRYGFYFGLKQVFAFSIFDFPSFSERRPPSPSPVGNKKLLGLVWLPSFGARIKEFIYDSINYLFGCHEIGYGIHFEFHGFSSYA